MPKPSVTIEPSWLISFPAQDATGTDMIRPVFILRTVAIGYEPASDGNFTRSHIVDNSAVNTLSYNEKDVQLCMLSRSVDL
jgi:hypothetical protein